MSTQLLEHVMDSKNPVIRLFISDLPETTDAMIPGGVYAVIADTPPARFPILATSIAGAIKAKTPTFLLVASSPKIFIERLSQVGFSGADDALETGHLQVFQLQEDFNKKMFRFGAEAFLNELDHFRLPAQCYLVIDQADELLSLHDISLALEQAEALSMWARKLKVTVLLVFTRVAAVPSSLATLTGLMDYLSGIVRLGGRQDGLDLTFEYWQSPESTVAAKVYGLSILDDGRYRIKPDGGRTAVDPLAGGQASGEAAEPEESPENLRYLYIDPSLAALSRQMVGRWQACDSVVSVLRAAFGARAPTVLLVFERHTLLRELAEAVHTLRLSLGRRARIVVIERDASLRYQNEILLLRLGTSLVVHRDVQENRVPLMLESLRGQIYIRDIEMNFDAALSSVVTSAKRGYLPPTSFVRETLGIIDRSDLLNLPCAMVIATPVNGKACTELLAQVHANRAGDMTSTDGRDCFIFFSGCPESSVRRALSMVLGDSGEQFFSKLECVVQRPELRRRLAMLTKEVAGRTFPDAIVDAAPVALVAVRASAAAPVRVSVQAIAPALVVAMPPAFTHPSVFDDAATVVMPTVTKELLPRPTPPAVAPLPQSMRVEVAQAPVIHKMVETLRPLPPTPASAVPTVPAVPPVPRVSTPAPPTVPVVAPAPAQVKPTLADEVDPPHVFGLSAAPAPVPTARPLRRAVRRVAVENDELNSALD